MPRRHPSKPPFSAAFQGEKGAFSQIAAQQFLGPDVDVLPCNRFEEVFRAVDEGRSAHAVIPIENTLHGSVHENYDLLLQFQLTIAAETQVRIAHYLIAPPGLKLRDVQRVYSHPVALNQCLRFFSERPSIERMSYYDTAGSVKMLMEEKPAASAAIASSVAAEIYGGSILKRNIEDDPSNFTRFFLLTKPLNNSKVTNTVVPVNEKLGWKTSLVFTTGNLPGALFRSLSAFALRDISLSKIESRPLKGKPYEYLFYLDLLGKPEDPKVEKALGHLTELADFLRVLGSYPRRV